MNRLAPTTTPSDKGSQLAWLRTSFALERTFMAWVRTATAMIGFGFTIVQFFAHFATTAGVAPPKSRYVPFILGLILVGTGVIALAVAFNQYRSAHQYLNDEPFVDVALHPRSGSTAWIAAGAVEIAGVVALLSILSRAVF